MTEQTINYDGPKRDTSIWTPVKDAHLKLAKEWVFKQPFKSIAEDSTKWEFSKYEFSQNCMDVLRLKPTQTTNKDTCADFRASGYKKNDPPPPPWKPQTSWTEIYISKWLASLAWVRALYMHELIENYIMISYHRFTMPCCTDDKQVRVHNLTCQRVKEYSFESSGERQIRTNNLNRCKDDLNKIIWHAGAFGLAAAGWWVQGLA